MKVGIFVGHSKLKSGAVTSSDGYVNEYAFSKKYAKVAVEYIKKKGIDAELIICPEGNFTSSTQERTYKIPIANKRGYNLIVECHLNAYDGASANGAECLIVAKGGKAEKVAKQIQSQFVKLGYRDRGVIVRPNLYMLRNTTPSAVIVEPFFCTNKSDCDRCGEKEVGQALGRGIYKFIVTL